MSPLALHGHGSRAPGTNRLALRLRPAYNRKWFEAYQARRAGDGARVRKLVRELTTGYVGITDVPGNDFLPELLELYPDARVVLVTRDPECWAQSVGHIRKHTNHGWMRYFMAPIPSWRWIPAMIDEFRASAARLRGEAGRNNPLARK